MRRTSLATALALAALGLPAAAGTITANCTGMLNLDIYRIESDQPTQDIDKIGPSQVTISDTEILLEGAFGTYRFDLKAGTLYQNGSDTGVYCTYKGLPG